MSNKLRIRVKDCSTMYLSPSKTTTIIRGILAKEFMIKIIRRKTKQIVQVRRNVQIISHPMDAMATVI